MINELYTYACPKMSAAQKDLFNTFVVIVCTALFSSLAAVFVNIIVGIVVTTVYVILSFLTFIDKDIKSRYMEQVSLCITDISIITIYMFSKIYPEYKSAFLSVIFGIVFLVIYEIVLIAKIKKKLYSNTSKSKKIPIIFGSSTVFVFTLIFKLLNKNPSTQDLAVFIFILLCATVILGAVISVQKLIIYLATRDKIQENFT